MRADLLCTVLACVTLALVPSGAWAATPHDPRCDAQLVTAARAAFKAAYAAGKFDDAANALGPVYTDCVIPHRDLTPEMAGAITNDLVLALHRAGKDHECLEVLETYWPDNRAPTPEFARLSAGLRRAMKFNWHLCRPGCHGTPDYDAVCQSIATQEEAEQLVPGFRHVACPFVKGQTAVALADGSCVALLAPRKSFEIPTAEQEDPHDICPTPAHITRKGGRTIIVPLQTPAHSFLLSLEHCCDKIDLAIDLFGQISAEPHDNPPEGCLFGHRTAVMQDIFRLEGGKFSLIKQLAEPWFQ